MSVSAIAPTPFPYDPDRLQLDPPAGRSDTAKAESTSEGDGKHLSLFAAGDDEPSFWDLLDIINPLQHIPIISDIYREITGDQIGVGARLAGGTLFGGPIGLIASAVDCVVEESTGKDTGEHMLALFRDDSQPAEAGATQVAQTEKPETATAKTVAAAPATPATPAATATAPPQPAAVTEHAPVIPLPGTATATAGGQPMVFSLNGMQDTAPSAATTAMPIKTTAKSEPMPLASGKSGRVMPLPERNPNALPAPMPLVTVPVSSSLSRSNVPITGQAPAASAYHAAATRTATAQEQLASHPMAPPTDSASQNAAGPDWFTTAWGQALDKYQRANQRAGKTGSSEETASTLQ